MSLDEIKKLVKDVVKLESRQLEAVMEIVKKNEPWLIIPRAPDYMEINFEDMSDAHLRKLESFIAMCRKKRAERREKGTLHSNEPMSPNEIRSLVEDLNQLRGYRFDGVVQIIQRNERSMRHWYPYEEKSEKPISLSKFRPKTLRKIRWYLEFSEDFLV